MPLEGDVAREGELARDADFVPDADLLREGDFAREEVDFVREADLVVPEGERPRLLARSRVPRSVETDMFSSSSSPADCGGTSVQA